MKPLPTPLRRSRLEEGLPLRGLGTPLYRLGLVASTSDFLLAKARAGAPHGSLAVAEGQSAGRGRRGHAWASPPRAGLYFSLLLRPPPQPLAGLAPALGVGAARALEDFGVPSGIKWPNDLLVGREKVGGLLVDLGTDQNQQPFAVVGVGLNVTDVPVFTSTPGALPATALARHLERPPARETLLLAMIHRIGEALEELTQEGVAGLTEAFLKRDVLVGATVRVRTPEGPATGIVAAIDPTRHLLLETSEGRLPIEAAWAHIEDVSFPD